MRQKIYFVIAILLLILWGESFALVGRELNLAWRRAFRAKVQAELLKIQLSDGELQERLKEKRSATLIFAGDVMLSRNVAKYIEEKSDPRYPFSKIADYLRSADLVFGNLEGPISARGKNQGSEYSFRADPKVAEGLVFAGFDILSLANNHAWDWGRDALEDTIDILRANDISPVGAGRNFKEANAPVVKNVGESKIAFFAFTDLYLESLEAGGFSSGISSFYFERIRKDIREIKNSGTADIVVISFHWGEEYKTAVNGTQRNTAHALIDAGADLVVGHHPHVIQEVEKYKDGWIAYSLGNFVFDQNFSEETKTGLILKTIVRDRKIIKIDKVYVNFSIEYQPYLAD